ncbi:MAG: recombinase family protein [Actinomycetota bacterium]|nr:recombinase family protein [Actinomycetota bacterium]
MTNRSSEQRYAVTYLRVGSGNTQDQWAVVHQREACQRIADKHGLTIVQEYADIGCSAKRHQQTELKRLLDDLTEQRAVTAVIVWDYARLARDLVQLEAVIAELRIRGLEVVTMTGVEVAQRLVAEQRMQTAISETVYHLARASRIVNSNGEETA